jgi:toxin ParE1/3/4
MVRMPGMGSTSLGPWCALPGMRAWRVNDIPMQYRFFATKSRLDVEQKCRDRLVIIAILTDGE